MTMRTLQNTVRPARRGVALLLVLGALVLISLIVVGFLTAVRQDRAASGFYGAGSKARQVADTGVGIVTAQIAEATANPGLAWISQPGLLRTFSSSGPSAAYKLYSSDSMKVDGAYNPETQAATEVPADWFDRPNEFVDLNRPVQVGANFVYPIADPDLVTGKPDGVEGFSIDPAAPTAAADSAAANDLPMPVKWIYILKDGSLATPAQAQSGSSEAVGRIGFWTDDETCKVNINTASDGVFYDSPAANTKEDHRLGLYQPIAQEYQRYPGHPATTSLASVIKELRNESNPVERSRLASLISPRIAWGGSKGGTQTAWWNKALGETDSDRLFASVGELAFARSGTSWNSAGGARLAPEFQSDVTALNRQLARYPFFLTTDSRAPELNLLNRPRITLWPFNKELVDGDSESSPRLTPEDRLIKFASELGGPPALTGQPRRKLYFQRENAWDPFHDYTNIQDNQDIYSYLQYVASQPFPSASVSRAGANSFSEKFTAAGRDQLITMMFDYLRSGVNTINYSYEPVGGPMYSFPQGHRPEISGFNDITPLVIDAGNGETKGLGKGLALNEFVLQFYALQQRLVDENDVEVTAGSGDAKYIIRDVQLVALADFVVTLADIASAMPRFQMKVSGASFELDPSITEGLSARLRGQANWSTTSLSIGFPNPSGDVNVVYNVGAEEADYSTNVYVRGGYLGLSYGLWSPIADDPKIEMLSSSGKAKVLARAAGYTNYPFISDVIQFRIPCEEDGTIPKDPVTSIPKAQRVEVSPATVSISLHPALAPGATTISNGLQAVTNTNYFQKTDLQLAGFFMPIPNIVSGTDSTGATWQWQDDDDPNTPTVPDMPSLTDYRKRIYCHYRNAILMGKLTDVTRAYHLATTSGPGGDLRLAAARREIPSSWYVPYQNWGTGEGQRDAYQGTPLAAYGAIFPGGLGEKITLRPGLTTDQGYYVREKAASLLPGASYNQSAPTRVAPMALDGVRRSGSSIGDFTSGYGYGGDGALVKGPDIGSGSANLDESPYYGTLMFSRGGTADNASTASDGGFHTNFTGLLFSPWKQMPSPVAFGTLPARPLDAAGSPWETLLFNPVPAGGKSTHRGWTELPRDHYWLDLFYMPVVEPFAITENLATNGKINLNQQIAPFTYIRRNSGLHALLRNLQIMAVPGTDTLDYKSDRRKLNEATNKTYRYPLDVSATVDNITARWSQTANDPFVSASEICEIPLVPNGHSDLDAFWSNKDLTADDKREMPYNSLYPRITTRSNTYTVYFCAQTLQGKPGKWTVTGQYRGSETIERYLDLATRPYGKVSGTAEAMFPALSGRDANGEPYYRFRSLSHSQFSP